MMLVFPSKADEQALLLLAANEETAFHPLDSIS